MSTTIALLRSWRDELAAEIEALKLELQAESAKLPAATKLRDGTAATSAGATRRSSQQIGIPTLKPGHPYRSPASYGTGSLR